MYKVMIVEDEQILRNGLRYLIDWSTYKCAVIATVSNGVEAMEELQRNDIDIVLLDINMPIMDGLTFLEQANQKYNFSTIILSGYDEFTYAKKAISYNVVEYLLKPLEEKNLIAALIKTIQQINKNNPQVEKQLATTMPENFGQIILTETKNEKEIAIMLNYIEKNYQTRISVEDLIPILNKSKSYLNNKFRNFTQNSFNEYLNRYRITKAIELIALNQYKIKVISEDVGFHSYRYFVEVFRKYTGVLPSDFKEFADIIIDENN